MSEKHNKGSALEQLRREALGAWRNVLVDLSATAGSLGKPDQSEIYRIERQIRQADRGELRRILAFLGTFRARAGEIRPVPCDELESALADLARRAIRGAAAVVDQSGGALDLHALEIERQVGRAMSAKCDRLRLLAWQAGPDEWPRAAAWLATMRPAIRVDLVDGAPIVEVGLVEAAPVKTH